MKKEMETIEAELKADREKIAATRTAAQQVQRRLGRVQEARRRNRPQMAEFNLKMGKLRKDFLEREAKVYYQTYLEVVDAVKYYAKRQNIGLVLRFNGEPVDPNRREDVLREINKPVVVQDQIDITPDVLALLNRDQRAQAADSRCRRTPAHADSAAITCIVGQPDRPGARHSPRPADRHDSTSGTSPPRLSATDTTSLGAHTRCQLRAVNARLPGPSR